MEICDEFKRELEALDRMCMSGERLGRSLGSVEVISKRLEELQGRILDGRFKADERFEPGMQVATGYRILSVSRESLPFRSNPKYVFAVGREPWEFGRNVASSFEFAKSHRGDIETLESIAKTIRELVIEWQKYLEKCETNPEEQLKEPLETNPEEEIEVKPNWSKYDMELSYDGKVIRKFKRNAPNCFPILGAFEESGWPSRIDCPFVPDENIEDRRTNAIRAINRELAGIRFERDGTTEGYRWSALV